MRKITRLAIMSSLAALLLTISNKSAAQDPTSESQVKQQAAKFFEEEDYASAYPLYSQLLSLYPEDPTYNYRTGACMLFTKADKEKPIDYLELAIKKPKIDNIAYFYLGRAYHLNYKFDAAIRTYQRFQKLASSSELKKYPVAHLIDQCNDAKTLLKNMHELDVLDKKELNYDDYFHAYDLSVNGGSVLVEPDDFKTKLDKKKNATSIIYLSADKNKVFFSSYGDDDKNGKDIYVVKRLPTGGFSKPENLGTIINSPYDEDFPFYDEPTKTLYFSSKGHNSMGGYDVFKSTYNETSDTWSSPVNMDFPINTPDDDILFIADTLNQTAFFASTRSSPKGSIDVYKIKIEPHAPEYVLMRGTTYGDDGKNIAVSTITVKNFKNDQVVGVYNSSPDNGSYLMSLPNAGKFVYTVETNGHKTQSEPVIIPLETGMITLKQQITYEPETDKLIIKNDFDAPGSDSDYLLALNYIKQKAQMEVHIDSNPSTQATNNTSQPLANNSNSSNNTSANTTQPNNSSNTGSNQANTNNPSNNYSGTNTNPNNSSVASNNTNPDSSGINSGNVSTEQLVKIADNDAKQDQELAKSMKEDASKATDYANDKLQQAQELQKEAQEITDNANNITDPAQKKDSLEKADALKMQSQELSKKAIEAYELAAQEQNQARDKQQQADQATNYSAQLDSAQKVSNNKQALAQLQEQHDKLLQQQQQQQANPPVATTPTELILQQAEATKQDSTEVAHHTDDLKKEVPTLQQQSQDYIAQAQKTDNAQEKLALLQQAKDLSDSKKQKEKEIKQNAKLEQQLHNQYIGQVAEAHSADSISKAAPQEVTSPQVAASDADLKKEIANYNPQANNNSATTNNSQPNNNTAIANNTTTNPTNNSTENSSNNTSANNTTQPNNNTTIANNTSTNPTNNATENPTNNTSTNNSTQPNNNTTVANNTSTNTTNNTTENPTNNTSTNNSTQPNNNTTVANNTSTNATNNATENPTNNTSANNNTQPNNNTAVANNTSTNPANNSTENPANNTSANNNTQPNNNTTVANNTSTNPTNNSTENPDNNTSPNNSTQPSNNTTIANNPTNNSTENPTNNTSTNNSTQPNNNSAVANNTTNNSNVSQTSSLYNTTPSMQSNTTTGVSTVIPTTTIQYSNPAASEASKSAAAFTANADAATGQANATRMQAKQTTDPQQAKLLYQKADSLDNVATQQKLAGTQYTNNANLTQYEGNQQQLASWQNTLQRNNSDKITTANLLVQDADFYYNKSINEKHKADSNKKSYIKESYYENAKQDIATALLKQQQAENIYLSIDPNVATEAASNTIVAANNPPATNTIVTPVNENNTQVTQNNTANTTNTSNSTTPTNPSNSLQSNQVNNSTNTTNNTTNLTSSTNNPTNSTSSNPDNNTSASNNTQQNNPANTTSTQTANKIDSMLSSPNNSTSTTQNNNTQSNNTTTQNNSTENPANNTSNNNTTQPNNNNSVATNNTSTQNNSTNNSTENPANNTSNNNTTQPNNNNSVATNNNSTQNNSINNSTENPASNTSNNNTTQPNNNNSVATNNNSTQNNSTNNSTENPTSNNTTTNTQPSNNTSAATNNNSTQNNSTNNSTENPTNNNTQPSNNTSAATNNNSTQNNSTNNSTENPANNTSANSTQPSNNTSVATNNNAAQNNSTNNSNSGNQPNNNSTASVQSANKIDSMLSSPNNASTTNNNSANNTSTNNTTQANNNVTQNNSTNNSTENTANNFTEANNTSTSVAPLSEDVFRESPSSPYSATKPIPVNPPLPQGLIYKVQIGAFRNPIPQNLFKGINPITGDKTPNGLTRYMAGIFKEYGGAKGAQDKIHQLGYRDAFIVAFLNGKRIPLSQANGTQGSNTSNNSVAANTQPDNNTSANNTTQTQVQPNATNAAPTTAIKDLKGLFYTVQVGAFQRPVPASSLYNLKPLFSYNGPNGYIRYNCGIYSNLPQANIAKQEIILKTPIKDAFIVAYTNGERIGLTQAGQLLNSGAATISTSPLLNIMPNGSAAANTVSPQISPEPNTNTGTNPPATNTVTPPAVTDTAKPVTNNITPPVIQNNPGTITAPTTSNPPPAPTGWSMTSRSLSSANIDPAGDITVSVTIHRGSITGFAKLEEIIPAGFTAAEGEKQNSTFKFDNGKASYLWLALPSDSIFTVSYKLSALSTASGQQTITGRFLYTANDEKQEVPIAPSTITVGGSAPTTVNTTVTPENPVNTTSTAPSLPDTSKNSKVTFCVQVGAYSGAIPVDMANKLLQISNQGIHAHKEDNGVTSYTVGEYPTYTSADLLKQELVKAGYTQSFIVAYYQGKKISLQQAQALINK